MTIHPMAVAVATGLFLALPAGLTGEPGVPRMMAPTVGAAPLPPTRSSAPDTLSLGRAVRRALRVDPALSRARAEIQGAEAATGVAEASLFPSLALSSSIIQFDEPMPVAPFHGFDVATAPVFDETLVQGRAGLDYTLWDGGVRGARIEGAQALESAAGARSDGTRAQILHEVTGAYLSVLTARDVLAAQRLRIEELEAERARVRRFLEAGTAPRVELLRAEAELSAARADEAAQEARKELAEAELARLLELPVAAVADAPLGDVALEVTDRAPGPDDPVDSAAVDDHPLVRTAWSRTDAARAGLRQAEAARLPRFAATGALNQYGATGREFSYEWQAGLHVDYPLFTGGARGEEQERAGAEVRAAEAELATARREVRRGVDRARSAEREARARVAALGDAVRRFEELARVEALALEEGVGVQRDLLRAQAGLLQARAGLARARRAVVLARVRLARARGLLTLQWMDQHVELLR